MPAVVFDLDGTLIHSAPDIHAAVNRTLAEEGAPPLGLEQVTSFIGNGVPVLIRRVMEARHEAPDAARHADLVARFMQHYEAHPADLTTIYPGVETALCNLAGAGWKLGLCTNKPEAASRAILAHFGLIDLFSVVIGGDSLPQRKPDPAPLRAAFAELAATPMLFVGDSEIDAATAMAAEVPFALFTEGYRHAPVHDLPHHGLFSHHDELPGLLRHMASLEGEPASAK